MAGVSKEAEALNSTLKDLHNHLYDMLSTTGKAMFFPKAGIFAQSAQAKGKKFDATIGIAKEDDNDVMCIKDIAENVSIDDDDVFPYAPVAGRPTLRRLWLDHIRKTNPTLDGNPVSMPIVTVGITHGIYLAAQLFLDDDDSIIIPKPYWENYDLMIQTSMKKKIESFDLFDENGLNIEGLKATLAGDERKIVLLLNFPQNPTGYSPTLVEASQIILAIEEATQRNNRIIVICDDAYTGLVYKENVLKESLFSRLCNLNERVLAIKLDGATKEYFAWGFRVGFITFGGKGIHEDAYRALEWKTMGFIRSSISNTSMVTQSLLEKGLQDRDVADEKEKKEKILHDRCLEVSKVLINNKKYEDYFKALPFNSGYFMCIRLSPGINTEKVRLKLINKYETGLIGFDDILRISYSCVAQSNIHQVFENIYEACKEVGRS